MRAMRSKSAMGVVVVSALVGLGGTALGGVIYDNGSVPDTGGNRNFFAQSPYNGFANTEFADDFILAPGASTIRDIHWYGDIAFGIAPEGELDSFTVTIYATAAGALAPGSVVAVAQITSIDRTPVDLSLSADTFLYSARVEDIVLEPDTRYWLGISGDGGIGMWGWRNTEGGNGVSGWTRSGSTGLFEPLPLSGEAAFYLTDDVPAPGALAVMGVVGVMGARRRR